MKTKPDSAIEHFKSFVRMPYAWPGGYPLFAVCNDGGCLCKSCAKKNARLILQDTRDSTRSGWQIAGIDANWEDPALYCDNCNARIESAYAEDEVQP
jgi:hypothetical protein